MAGNRSTMIDWDLAVTAASKMSGPGPMISRGEAEAVVAELRAGAHARRRWCATTPASSRRAQRARPDRRPARLIQANVDGFATIISPLVEKLQERKGAPRRWPRRSAPA